MRRAGAFTLAGLAVALLAAVLLSSFASPDPDGLESAVLKTQCADEPDVAAQEACLEEAAGEPVYDAAPLPDYEITPLSGLLGVLASFGIAAGAVALARRGRRSAEPSGNRPPAGTRPPA